MKNRLHVTPTFALAILILQALVGGAGLAQVVTNVATITGDPAPDGNGSFSVPFNNPVLNDSGQVAFSVGLTGTSGDSSDDRGVFRSDGAGNTLQIVREGEFAPDGNSIFFNLPNPTFKFGPALNSVGQVVFGARLTGDGRDSLHSGIFRANGAGSLVQNASAGDVAPDGNFADILGGDALNSFGHVAFSAGLTDTSSGDRDDSGVFLSDGAGSQLQIARKGDLLPDANGSFSSFNFPFVNDSGQVAFSAGLTGTSGGSNDDLGIFRGDGIGSPVQIVRKGAPAPDGNGRFSSFDHPTLNEAGQAAFRGFMTDTNGGSSDNIGIYRGDGNGSPVQIARGGDPVPDGSNSFLHFSFPAQNNAGQIAFDARLTDASNGTIEEHGLYFHDDLNGLTEIARTGDPAPDGNGTIQAFGTPAVNDSGQVAFVGLIADSVGNEDVCNFSVNGCSDFGLYLYDELGNLHQLARSGDDFLGSRIMDLRFASDAHPAFNGPAQSGLNAQGQVAFRFRLMDGREGIAIASVVPEPSAFGLAVFAYSALMLRRRR